MPDAIAFNPVQQPDVGQTLSTILGLQQRRLAIQQGQANLQSDKADATTKQMILGERQRLAAYVSNPANKGRSADDMSDDISALAPTTGQDYLQKIRQNEATHAEVASKLTNLSADNKKQVSNVVKSLYGGTDTPEQVHAKLDGAALANPQLAPIIDTLRNNVEHLPPPGPDRDAGVARAAYALDGTVPGVSSTQDTGATLQPRILNPITGAQSNAPGANAKTVAPQIGTSTGGQAAVISNNGVNVLPSRGQPQASPPTAPGASIRPRTAADDAPPSNAPRAVQDAYSNSVTQAQNDVKAARDADANYGTSVHVSNVIRKLGKDTTTGPGSDVWHTMMAGIPGAVSQTANNAGADYQVIGSMLDRQAAMARSSMGLPGTNAGAEDSRNIAGNTQFAPQALATKNNLTQALTEGAHQFRQGLEKVGGFTTNPSPNAVNKYKQEWTANFNPDVYRAIRAHDENDTDELNALRKELGPQGFKSLSQKASNLISLSNTGHLPQ